jgi:hypothetical protein
MQTYKYIHTNIPYGKYLKDILPTFLLSSEIKPEIKTPLSHKAIDFTSKR